MDKQKVIERFCSLATEVGAVKFKNKIPSDCFCHLEGFEAGFQFDEDVLIFIEAAVRSALDWEVSCKKRVPRKGDYFLSEGGR